jgi:hypothetical protein
MNNRDKGCIPQAADQTEVNGGDIERQETCETKRVMDLLLTSITSGYRVAAGVTEAGLQAILRKCCRSMFGRVRKLTRPSNSWSQKATDRLEPLAGLFRRSGPNRSLRPNREVGQGNPGGQHQAGVTTLCRHASSSSRMHWRLGGGNPFPNSGHRSFLKGC